jgi:hypothetical protein
MFCHSRLFYKIPEKFGHIRRENNSDIADPISAGNKLGLTKKLGTTKHYSLFIIHFL